MPKNRAERKPADAYHHGDLRSALISAGSRLLEEDGPEAISFRGVSRAAGVSQAAPYNHFRNKEELLATIAEGGFQRLAATQREALALPSIEKRLVELGVDYVRFAATHPQLYRLMFGGFLGDWNNYPSTHEAKLSTYLPVKEALADLLGASPTDRRVESAALACWSLVHGLSMLSIDTSLEFPGPPGAGARDRFVGDAIRLFYRGVRPQKK